MFRLVVVLLLTGAMAVWLFMTDERRTTKEKRSVGSNYREQYKYGELTKRGSLGRGKLVALTPENIQAFSDRFNRSDIFCSVLRYSGPDERLYESLRWGDLCFSFEIPDDDIYADKDGMTASSVLSNARRLVRVFEREYAFPLTAFRMFFTGKGFDILVSAAAMGVEPRMELCEIYESIVKEIAEEHDIQYLNTNVYKYRAVLRVNDTLNSDVSTKVPRHKIELSYKEFMTLSIREMDLLSRKPRQPGIQNEYFDRVEHAACVFYDDAKRKFDASVGQLAFVPEKSRTLLRPCVQLMLEGGIEERYQKRVASIIAQEYRRLGSRQAVTLERLSEWNRKNQPILSDPEVEEISAEVYSRTDHEVKSCDDSVLAIWCTGPEKCTFYYEFQEHQSKMLKHSEALFEAYKWPQRLGIPQTALYRAIVAFESKRGVSPGDDFIVSVDELASYIGANKKRLVVRYLYDLKRAGLIEDYGLRDDSANVLIRRVIPIPDNPKSEWA